MPRCFQVVKIHKNQDNARIIWLTTYKEQRSLRHELPQKSTAFPVERGNNFKEENTMKRVSALLLTLLMALTLVACGNKSSGSEAANPAETPAASGDTIKIGYVSDLTGATALWGTAGQYSISFPAASTWPKAASSSPPRSSAVSAL